MHGRAYLQLFGWCLLSLRKHFPPIFTGQSSNVNLSRWAWFSARYVYLDHKTGGFHFPFTNNPPCITSFGLVFFSQSHFLFLFRTRFIIQKIPWRLCGFVSRVECYPAASGQTFQYGRWNTFEIGAWQSGLDQHAGLGNRLMICTINFDSTYLYLMR